MPESRYLVGDVFEQLATLADGSIDVIITSPPFLSLRSYLPDDDPNKTKEIGGERTPADFLDTLLLFSEACRRVLAPHGSLCVELGDTYSGSGGPGGDYNAGGMRAGQPKTTGSAARARNRYVYGDKDNRHGDEGVTQIRNKGGTGWPLNKSLCMVPSLYAASLAYGHNLLRPEWAPKFEPWRVRNWISWCRTNPPVGRLGDKFRPASSFITVACTGSSRYFDLDAVRIPSKHATPPKVESGRLRTRYNEQGAPPLDWHVDFDEDDADGIGFLQLATQPYKGSHYATFPMKLPMRLIEAMCPLRVCRTCGKPSERLTETTRVRTSDGLVNPPRVPPTRNDAESGSTAIGKRHAVESRVTTLGWSDCGHENWRPGVILDPFAGSGTTLVAAHQLGRDSVGVDLDIRNRELFVQRMAGLDG